MKKSWKGKVSANNKKAMAYSIQNGDYWQDSELFNPDLQLDACLREVAKGLFEELHLNEKYKIEKKLEDFEVLVANLLNFKNTAIALPLDKNKWKSNRYNSIGFSIVNSIKRLQQNGLIDMKRGYKNRQTGEGRISRISATSKFWDMFPKLEGGIIMKPRELVILKDLSGNLKDYTDTRRTRQLRKILEEANRVNNNHKIECEEYSLTAYIKAIYMGSFDLYGRLHTSGYRHYQGRRKEDRQEIKIDNQPTVELDYEAMHLNLLYASEKINLKHDPYTIIDERKAVRPFLKIVMLSMLNTNSLSTAEKAANYWLFENPRERKKLNDMGIKSAKPIIKKLRTAHEDISHHFFTGKKAGLRLMNKDAQIALKIVKHFTNQDRAILPIHDSFIVDKRYESELYKLMRDTYKEHTNGFDIRINRTS